MNKNMAIDTVFKSQLQQMEQPGADENWQRLETQLLAQNKKKRRRAAGWLGLLLLLGGGVALVWSLQGNNGKSNVLVASASKMEQGTTVARTVSNNTTTIGLPNEADMAVNANNNDNNTLTGNNNINTFNKKGRQTMRLSGGDIATGVNENSDGVTPVFANKASQKLNIQTATAEEDAGDAEEIMAVVVSNPTPEQEAKTATTNHSTEKQKTAVKEATSKADEQEPPTTTAARKQKKPSKGKVQLELAAGIDISTNVGKYGVAMLRIPLNPKANLLVGAGYTSTKMVEGYKATNKPNALNREIDAKVQGLTMLQFPVLYEQYVKENKLFFRAGVTPVYILDASIINMSSYAGNPALYRTFTMKDINKFNVLFTAGFQYRLSPRLGVELKGNYGLTELVKNSYINQSGENNNCKSAQVGLLIMLGKKK